MPHLVALRRRRLLTQSDTVKWIGGDLRTVHKILGHRTPLMTMRYAHLSDAHMAEAAAKLRNRLKQKPDSAMDTLWTPPEIGTESQREAQS